MKFLYNGVTLPELPAYSKTNFPYALIHDAGGGIEFYVLALCSGRPYYGTSPEDSSVTGVYATGVMQVYYFYPATDSQWRFQLETENPLSLDDSLGMRVIWTDTTIVDQRNNSVWLAASDPVSANVTENWLRSFKIGLALGLTGKGLPLIKTENPPSDSIMGDASGLVYDFNQDALQLDIIDSGVAGNSFVLTGNELTVDNRPQVTFSIDGVEFQTFQGRIWRAWTNSEYNTFVHPELGSDWKLGDDGMFGYLALVRYGPSFSCYLVRNEAGETIDLSAEIQDGLVLHVDIPTAVEISFTIGGTTYYAEEGMTWGEWVESEYNTYTDAYGSVIGISPEGEARNYNIQDGFFGVWVCSPSHKFQKEYDTIEANTEYHFDM